MPNANVTPASLKHTPLYKIHVSLKGRLVPFAGWEMPVQYSGILDEVRIIRGASGLFDVSHMGRLRFEGPNAAAFLNRFLSANVPALEIGQGKYHVICNANGGIIDDAVVYRVAEERYLLVVNASNTQAVLDWIGPELKKAKGVEFNNRTGETAMIAFQGPKAAEIMKGLTPADLSQMKAFRCQHTSVAGKSGLLCRTGYTGEDGFEIILPAQEAESVWLRLMDKGARPCGLGARDVLRLEAALLLHGNDMDTSVNPFEAGLERFVFLDKEDYVPGPALRRIKEQGVARKLVGFELLDRAIARHGYAISQGGKQVGNVTSGTFSPTLDKSIGLGYVPVALSAPDTRLQIDLRGNLLQAKVVPLPFYSRKKK